MPVLSNHRHERFAQELAKGKTAIEAYGLAGYKPVGPNASRLITNDKIQARVAELQAKVAAVVVKETGLSRLGVLSELAKIAKAPTREDQVRPADKRAALVDYARIEGWVIERTEHGSPGEFEQIENMNADQLRAYIDRFAAEVGLRDVLAASAGGTGKARRPH